MSITNRAHSDDAAVHCTSCGAPSDPSWRFCGSCGGSVGGMAEVILLPTAAVAAPRRRVRRPSRRTAIRIVAACAVVTLLAAASVAHLRMRHHLDATKTALASTAAELDTTKSSLHRATLDVAERTSERDDLQRSLDSANGQLADVRSSLSDAKERVNFQASQIDALKTCLTGVSGALSYVADGSYDAAIASLDAVQSACKTASAAF